jgi:hypothetical protein
MNKKELLEALKNFSDDTEITLWEWDGKRGIDWYLNQTLQNDPRQPNFSLSNSLCEFKGRKTIQQLEEIK